MLFGTPQSEVVQGPQSRQVPERFHFAAPHPTLKKCIMAGGCCAHAWMYLYDAGTLQQDFHKRPLPRSYFLVHDPTACCGVGIVLPKLGGQERTLRKDIKILETPTASSLYLKPTASLS